MPSATRVVVLVLGGEGPGEGLVGALGPERATAVHALLLERALAWAEAAFGAEAVRVVAESSFTAALAAGGPGEAAGDAGEAAGGPAGQASVLAIVPVLPVWHPALAAAALDDLRAGCALTLAPIFDRGLYLLALADPSADRAAALAALDLAGPGGMGELRAERGLRRARDVHALLADPLTDPELRALLE
jgi:hypothetical protein